MDFNIVIKTTPNFTDNHLPTQDILVFNPEHDYALANNDEHFMALQSAVQFANDCAPFLHYLRNDDNHFIFKPYSKLIPDLSNADPQEVTPWGWDKLVVHQLRKAGLPEAYLPTASQIDKIHELSHRKTSITAMQYLHKHCPQLSLPRPASQLHSIQEIAEFITHYPDAIFKSPYSGNGRGNLYAHGILTPTLERQLKGVICRQGSILAEPLYPITQDFAMEYLCRHDEVKFVGYSLFNTKYYGYAGNALYSDKDIEDILIQWTRRETLHTVRESIHQFLKEHILPYYQGYLGVDMFIYSEEGQYKLNPMVEINLRMTMGMAAHIIFQQHVHPQSTGTMSIEYNRESGKLLKELASQPDMQTQNGLWTEGTIALNPVYESTKYAVVVKLSRKS